MRDSRCFGTFELESEEALEKLFMTSCDAQVSRVDSSSRIPSRPSPLKHTNGGVTYSLPPPRGFRCALRTSLLREYFSTLK